MSTKPRISVDGVDINITGRFVRTARVADEYYIAAPDPEHMVQELKAADQRVDVITFVQELHDLKPRFPYERDVDRVALLAIKSYRHWMDKQIKFKCRNKIKKGVKAGVETHVVELSDELLKGIKDIYDETRVRQGKRNWHYGKPLEVLKREHSTFLDRSEFIGAYANGELIGFAKVTHSPNYSVIMNIVAKVASRGLAPANALIAKTIEVTAARGIPLLKYGVWGRRGLNDFKVSSAFECAEVPRYYIPLTDLGRLALRVGWHRGLAQRLPESVVGQAALMRDRWIQWRYGNSPGRNKTKQVDED